jgi:hypothetical protein
MIGGYFLFFFSLIFSMLNYFFYFFAPSPIPAGPMERLKKIKKVSLIEMKYEFGTKQQREGQQQEAQP